MSRIRSIAALGLGLWLAPAAVPTALQAQKLDFTKNFMIVSEKNAGKLNKILERTGTNGFRVVTGSLTGGDAVELLLQKEEGQKYEYTVIAADNTQKVERQLKAAAEQGFRLLPNTITAKDRTMKSRQITMVLERSPGSAKYEYLLLEASLGSSAEVLLKGAIDQGYRVVGLMTRKDQSLVILEKAA